MADKKKMPKDSKPEKAAPKKAEKKQSWSETVKNTGVVLMVTVVIGAGVWISDLLFRQLIDLVYRLAGTGTAEAAVVMLQNLF